MRRFNSACGFLMALLLVATMAFGRQGGVAPQLIGAGFVVVAMVWLVVQVVVVLLHVMMTLARGIAGDIAGGTGSARRQARQVLYEPQRRHAGLPQYDLIERLCRESGWVLASREADFYQVRPGDHRAIQYVEIRYGERFAQVLFQSFFPIRFSLQQPPTGLSERLLMRNRNLHWSSWTAVIGGSCEQVLYVGASIPAAGLNAWLFGQVCGEMVNEIHAFHQELHEKYRYGLGGVAAKTQYLPPPGRPGLPQRRGDHPPGIWYES